MDRELLIEIGVEEIPASWLPGLTTQVGTRLDARLKELRLPPAAPIETYSTPRRLTVRVGKLAERQTDLEEVLTGPPVSAAFDASGQPTPAAVGFAKKHGVEVGALERLETPKGTYLASEADARQGGGRRPARCADRAAARADVPEGDAAGTRLLDDGKGELPFGRPIRWLLFLTAAGSCRSRSIARRSRRVRSSRRFGPGAVTFGHRFLTTSGRAGRAIKVKGFDDYRKRLAENFVVLERSERQERIARELDVEARRRGGRVVAPGRRPGAAAGSAGPRRVPEGRLGHVRRRVPRAARGSADDDDDSPPALLSGRERARQAAAGVSRRPQHGRRQA